MSKCKERWKYALGYFVAPLKAAFKDKLEFFLWVLFVIFAGQSGTIINVINRCVFGDMKLTQSILADSVSGNFYTFSLVIITSAIGSLFIKLTERREHEHRRITVLFVAIFFMLSLFNAVFFSFATQDYAKEYADVSLSNITVDGWQLIFFVVAVFAAVYTMGLTKISKYPEFDHLEQYKNEEKRNINKLQEGNNVQNNEADGIAI